MRLLFIQHGDYAAAWRRFEDGEPETYRDQRASVRFVADLAERCDVLVASLRAPASDAMLAPRLRAMTIPPPQAYDASAMGAALDAIAPDLIICRTPHLVSLRWARRRRIPTLPCFADLFSAPNMRAVLSNLRLRLTLADRIFPCVANHSLNASLSAARILRYPRDRIVPWDWSRLPVAPQRPLAFADPTAPRAFYAGGLKEAKGLGDCLEAVRLLRAREVCLRLDVAGGGDVGEWIARARQLGVEEAVRFLGRIPHEEVRAKMSAADLVLVPSRHDYPEGLPNTIYEALAARAPLALSDHPAFVGRLVDGEACVMFRAGDPASLADAVVRLTRDPALQARLSAAGPAAHEALYVGMEWSQLVSAFLDDPANATGWVQSNSLKGLKL